MPTVVSGGKSYASASSTRKEMKSVECQTSLTWFFSEHPLRTVLSLVRSSGGPGSVSAGTQASSGRSRPASADDQVPCDPAKSSETVKGSADPSKRASKGSTVPSKTGPKGYNTIQLYCLYVEKFAFWLVIYIKTFNTVNNRTSTTQ